MTEDNGAPLTETPPQVRDAVRAQTRARMMETLVVLVACLLGLALVGTTAWNTARLRKFNSDQVKAQEFGLHALDCLLDNFSEHRWSNQAFHDSLAEFLHSPVTPRVPLPGLPTQQQFDEDCGPFNRGKIDAPSTVSPTVPMTTSTLGGHG